MKIDLTRPMVVQTVGLNERLPRESSGFDLVFFTAAGVWLTATLTESEAKHLGRALLRMPREPFTSSRGDT